MKISEGNKKNLNNFATSKTKDHIINRVTKITEYKKNSKENDLEKKRTKFDRYA